MPPNMDSLEKCVEAVCCPGGKYECYHRLCDICKDHQLVSTCEDVTQVWWWEWDYEVNDVLVRGVVKKVRKIVKKRRSGSVTV